MCGVNVYVIVKNGLHLYVKPLAVAATVAPAASFGGALGWGVPQNAACFFSLMRLCWNSSCLFIVICGTIFFVDSTVLAYVLSELNRRHNYGLDLFLLSVDEGITGYRDDSLETVKRNEIQVSRSSEADCFSILFVAYLL